MSAKADPVFAEPRANSTLIAGSSGNSARWGEIERKHGSIAISRTSVRDPPSTFGQPTFEE
jgi:hypothetical protein